MIPTFAREKSRMEQKDKIYYGLSIALFLLTILLYTYPSIQAVHQFYEVQKLQSMKRKLMIAQNRLRLEYEMLMSPDEMEARARSRGYAEPAGNQVVYIKKVR
ncbi:MAG: hypothetical protein IEMM0002_1133 [bacterium]|nr:MAG: hypothetical protein IEMM0002_1133 [bacterium]